MAETATALQLSFEEAVVESYNLYEMATKGNTKFELIPSEVGSEGARQLSSVPRRSSLARHPHLPHFFTTRYNDH